MTPRYSFIFGEASISPTANNKIPKRTNAPFMVNPAATSPSDAMMIPIKIDVTRRIFETSQDTNTTATTIRPASALIIHSCVIIVPRAVSTVIQPGRLNFATRLDVSTQSTIKFGSMSNSCMNISQKPDIIRINSPSFGFTIFLKVIFMISNGPMLCSPPAGISL